MPGTVTDVVRVDEVGPEELLEQLKQTKARVNMLEYSYDQLLNKGSRKAAQQEQKSLLASKGRFVRLWEQANSQVRSDFETWQASLQLEYEDALNQLEDLSNQMAAISTRDKRQDDRNPEYIKLKRQYDTLMINIDVKFFVLQRQRQAS